MLGDRYKFYGRKAMAAVLAGTMILSGTPVSAIAAELTGSSTDQSASTVQASDTTAPATTTTDTASSDTAASAKSATTSSTDTSSTTSTTKTTDTTTSTSSTNKTSDSSATTNTSGTDKTAGTTAGTSETSKTDTTKTSTDTTADKATTDTTKADTTKTTDTSKSTDTTKTDTTGTTKTDTTTDSTPVTPAVTPAPSTDTSADSSTPSATTDTSSAVTDTTEDATPVATETVSNRTTSKTTSTSASSSDYHAAYVAHHYTEDITTEKFIASIGEEARQIGQEHNLYASVMIAQAILESGNGTSELSQAPNYNLFGIKGVWTDSDGVQHSKTYSTLEDDGTGATYATVSSFRTYNSTADSLADYANLLTNTETGMGEYYSGAWKSNTQSYVDACNYLQGRYATDTSYAQKLEDIIETYDLTRYDEKLDYEITGSIYDPTSELADENGYRPLTMDDYVNLEAVATAQLGTDYVWGGNSPEVGFDCSGLTSWSYKTALGIDTTRLADTQALQGVSVPVDVNDLRMGDLLFFENATEGVHHVAMYLGDGYYIQSPKIGSQVTITSLDYYTPSFARRIINFKDVSDDTSSATSDSSSYVVTPLIESEID